MSAETPPTNRNWLIVLVILLLLLPLCCIATLCGTFVLGIGAYGSTAEIGDVEIDGLGDLGELETLFKGDDETARDSFDETFEVDGQSSLIVGMQVGSVKVTVGGDDEVIVEGEIKAFGSTPEEAEDALDRVEVKVDQRGDVIEILAEWREPSGWNTSSPKVDLTIKVPENTDADITIDVGDVEIKDTVGDLKITADVGDVSIRDVLVKADMEVTADVGEIEFRGELGDGANYQLSTDVGKVAMYLPDDSSFEIDASSGVGDVSIDFEVDGTEDRELVSKTVTGFVGDDDTGTVLILRSDVGAVVVKST